jgi:molybdenum ABC transporter molybdate-binding protein
MPALSRKIFLVLVLFLDPLALKAEELTIAVASNFVDTISEIIRQFEAQSQHSIRLSFGSSGQIFAQIINGAPYDMFFSADQEKPLELENRQLIAENARFTYAVGRLVLWSRSPSINLNEGDILKQGDFTRLAMANPRLAPYGQAAEETLQALDAFATSQNKLVYGQNVTQAFQFVESGNAEVGFVALSQLQASGLIAEGSAWFIPESYHAPILQDAVILKRAANSRAAAEFRQFMQGDQGAKIIQRFGYRVP